MNLKKPTSKTLVLCLLLVLPQIVLAEHHQKKERQSTITDCSHTTDPECKKSKRYRIYLFTQGREAYDKARETGDFSEAFRIARILAAQNDRNGERLLKMTIIQLGWGNNTDKVQAYKWIQEAVLDGVEYAPVWLKKLTFKMSEEELTEVQQE